MPRTAYTYFVLLFIASHALLAQSASDYLPANIGSTWRYQRFAVDGSQNPVASSKTIETDSLAGTTLINGISALVIRNRTNPLRDSTLVRTHGDSISTFNGGFTKEGIRLVSDSLGLGFLPQAPGWYTYVKLKTPPAVNVPDTLYRHDSVLTIDGTEFDLRLFITRTMKPLSAITVPAGTFNAVTPYEINLTLNWWVFTPLGRRAQPFLKLRNVIYLANNKYVIKETQDSTYFPLTATTNDSIPKFTIPGYVRLLEKLTPTSVPIDAGDPGAPGLPARHARNAAPDDFRLSQNFPNPFNGTTTIAIELQRQSVVSARITDVLGRTVDTVSPAVLSAGTHTLRWNSGTVPSGVYFYHVNTGHSHAVQRMLLQK